MKRLTLIVAGCLMIGAIWHFLLRPARIGAVEVGLAQTPTPDKDRTQPDKEKDRPTKLVDEPQPAVILKKDNTRIAVILVSLDSKELQYKLRQTEKKARIFTTKEIKAIQIVSGEMFAVNPKSKAFEAYDPRTNTFSASGRDDAKAIGKEEEGKDNKKPQTEKVVAEGVGATGDEALKDAFRNAVRQVVGAVVDAETLVKNDEIISDKVLTYSDGFVKSYDEISKKQDKGLIRVKIAASVERRSVIAKLKAANISVRDVDGKGLFAEVVTQLEAEKNAAALVEKALDGFPLGALDARVVGKPELIEKKESGVKVRITVQYQANKKEYEAFVKRLQTTLGKIAKAKGEFVMSALATTGGDEAERHAYYGRFTGTDTRTEVWRSYIPMGFKKRWEQNTEQVLIALNTLHSNDRNKTVWFYYVLDESVRVPLERCHERPVIATLSLLGGNGKAIAVDRLSASEQSEGAFGFRYPATLISSCYGHYNRQKKESLYIISPLFFERLRNVVTYRQTLRQQVQFSLSLDDLKAIESMKCELSLEK